MSKSNTNPSLSIIIVNYNVEDHLKRCLRSIDSGADVWVVDNASTDGSVEQVKINFPWVKIIESQENLGFSKAINRAVREAKGDCLLLLNPDTEFKPESYTFIKKRCSQLHAKAFGFRQVDAQGNFQLSFGFRPNLSNELMRRSIQRRLDRKGRWLAAIIDRIFSKPTSVSWVAGSSLLVGRDAFEKIDGFDENFFLFFEDIDFCLRLEQSGINVIYEPSITLLHHRGESSKVNLSLSKQAYRQSQRYFWTQYHGALGKNMIEFYQRMRGIYY